MYLCPALRSIYVVPRYVTVTLLDASLFDFLCQTTTLVTTPYCRSQTTCAVSLRVCIFHKLHEIATIFIKICLHFTCFPATNYGKYNESRLPSAVNYVLELGSVMIIAVLKSEHCSFDIARSLFIVGAKGL